MPPTRTVQRLEDRLETLAPGTVRHAVLQAAVRFKSSWVELGRVLWTVWRDRAFRAWGYLSFEAYCAKELRIKAVTAKKLLNSYQFLEREEPAWLARLADSPSGPVPDYEAVNLLRLLKQREPEATGEYQTVRTYVLEEGREAPAVRHAIRTLSAPTTEDPAAARVARRRALLQRVATTLKAWQRELTVMQAVPASLIAQLARVSAQVEGLLQQAPVTASDDQEPRPAR